MNGVLSDSTIAHNGLGRTKHLYHDPIPPIIRSCYISLNQTPHQCLHMSIHYHNFWKTLPHFVALSHTSHHFITSATHAYFVGFSLHLVTSTNICSYSMPSHCLCSITIFVTLKNLLSFLPLSPHPTLSPSSTTTYLPTSIWRKSKKRWRLHGKANVEKGCGV